MSLISWQKSFSVDVAEIDKQHQRLVALMNQLNDAMLAGKSNEALGRTVGGLLDYTVYHFGAEEGLLERYAYPGLAVQKSQHREFVRKVSEFKQSFEEGKLCLSIEVMNFLSDWLRNHILGTDKQYASFLNDKGLN